MWMSLWSGHEETPETGEHCEKYVTIWRKVNDKWKIVFQARKRKF